MRFKYVLQVLGSRGNYLDTVKFNSEQEARDFVFDYLKEKPPKHWRLMRKELTFLPV
jgi:hypothetical protein